MVATHQPLPFRSLNEWASHLREVYGQTVEQGLSEAHLINAVFEALPQDAPNRLLVIETLLIAIEQSPLLSESTKADIRRQTWANNQTVITYAVQELLKTSGRVPTLNAIARKAGLSRQTVAKHLKAFQQNSGYHLQQQALQLAREQVVAQLYSMAMTGHTKAAQLFLETTQPDTPQGASTNYIQINNTRIDQVMFARLPAPIQQQISHLIEDCMAAPVDKT